MDTQAVKHAIQHSGRYNRRGFESPTQRAKALARCVGDSKPLRLYLPECCIACFTA